MRQAKIFYFTLLDEQTRAEKLDWFKRTEFKEIPFQQITPDRKANWINANNNDFDNFLPIATKDVKLGRRNDAIFSIFSLGVKTDRDEWIYDFSLKALTNKSKYMVETYQERLLNSVVRESDIKWDGDLITNLERGIKKEFSKTSITPGIYRPFTSKFLYYDKHFNKRLHQLPSIFQSKEEKNLTICFTDVASQKPFMVLVVDKVPDFHLVGAAATAQCLPLYRYEKDGTRVDNITNWGLNQFRDHYNNSLIQTEDIFYYVYAVLHHPAYRTQYEFNLKREFPRIPFYTDFQQWATWGKQLMDLHINFEEADPYDLDRIGAGMIDQAHAAMQASFFELENSSNQAVQSTQKAAPKCKLKADKVAGTIAIDTATTLTGIPAIAWDYKLGNRSALEWVLDQYKEKKPKDPTIAKLFNTYKFADYKEHVIDLLKRVCTVSVETMYIIQQMPDDNS